eukprot:5728027-Pyramimonas_sp.AAC.1
MEVELIYLPAKKPGGFPPPGPKLTKIENGLGNLRTPLELRDSGGFGIIKGVRVLYSPRHM